MRTLSYALVFGVVGIAFMAMMLGLFRALIGATEIEAVLLSLPFG